MKVAIVGLGYIGKFHIREFFNSGCEIIAIVDTNLEILNKTKIEIEKKYGIKINVYQNILDLLKSEKIDCVSICTPAKSHEYIIRKFLESGIHVFCEKPFILNSEFDNLKTAKDLIKISNKRNLILSVNNQWASVINYVKDIIDLKNINSFSMHMEPGVIGVDMLIDSISHMNSILIKLIPNGLISDINFLKKTNDNINIEFNYKNSNNCKVNYEFYYKSERPRNVYFSINGVKFIREIDKDYNIFLIYNNKKIKIEDPLKTSIKMFVSAIKNKAEPLINKEEILKNTELQDLIVKKFLS